MLRLFDCLETEPNVLFRDSYREGGRSLSASEQALLRQYRGLSLKGRETVRSVVDALCAYRDEVEETGPEKQEPRVIPLYRNPAAAGYASPVFGEDFDFETHPACRELVALKEKWDGYDNGRIRVEASVHGEYTSDYRLWDALSEFAINEKVGMHVHLSETKAEHEQCLERNGLTPAQVLDCHHVFDTRAIAAHCVWVTPEDMRLLAKRGVTAVHCPVSNLKLASGCAPVTEMVKAGMNVALGTDSSASNNNLDLFEEMKAAALMAKVTSGDPKALPVEAVLMMATVCGARAQGREAECGMLKLGMDADLVLLDFTSPHLMPCHNVMSHLVYAASGHDVVMTMVRGQVLYAAGKYPTIDLDSVVRELSGYVMPRIFEEARS